MSGDFWADFWYGVAYLSALLPLAAIAVAAVFHDRDDRNHNF